MGRGKWLALRRDWRRGGEGRWTLRISRPRDVLIRSDFWGDVEKVETVAGMGAREVLYGGGVGCLKKRRKGCRGWKGRGRGSMLTAMDSVHRFYTSRLTVLVGSQLFVAAQP